MKKLIAGILFGLVAAATLIDAPPAPAQTVGPVVNIASFRNRVLNGNFVINQRGYASGATTPASNYTFDRWKFVGTGGTLLFGTQTTNDFGVNISGVNLVQVVDPANVEGGAYTLSWQVAPGSVTPANCRAYQGTIGGGGAPSFSNSPVTYTGFSSNVAINVECSTGGSIANVQLEPGTVPTAFERRPISLEYIMCQRYYQSGQAKFLGSVTSSSVYAIQVLTGPMRTAAPTITVTNSSVNNFNATFGVTSITNGFVINHSATASNTGTFVDNWAADADF